MVAESPLQLHRMHKFVNLQTLRAFTFTVKDSGQDSLNFSVKNLSIIECTLHFQSITVFFFSLSSSTFKALKFSLTSQCLLASKKFWQRVAFIHILSRAVIGFPASSYECDENTLLDHEITTNFSLF